ncbi:NEDD4-binding protein 2-like 2 [Petaurus breviceps papuanus]|uniref:NEDD4-binding protein 2-like 2 n=1 Tax=Petaurus breviceps papuanus TaxID=3040969 RepID=UPI0036D767B9
MKGCSSTFVPHLALISHLWLQEAVACAAATLQETISSDSLSEVDSNLWVLEKTENNWIPLSIFDKKENGKTQESKTETTVLLKLLGDVISYNRPDNIESFLPEGLQNANPTVVSMNSSEVSRNNCIYVSGNIKEIRMEGNHKVDIPVSGEEVEYSTSKAFIGPIYKSPEENKPRKRKHHIQVTGGVENKQNPSSNRLNIDNELSQFYKEIQELESEKEDLEGNCQEFKTPQEQFILHYQDHYNDNLKSDEEKKDTWFETIHSPPGDEQ